MIKLSFYLNSRPFKNMAVLLGFPYSMAFIIAWIRFLDYK